MDGPAAGARVIAIDPGRDKCGVAALAADGRLLHRTVVPTPDLTAYLSRLAADLSEATLVIGDGTSSKDAQARLCEAFPNARLEVIGEAHSTERALERWRDVMAPRGWRRLVPRALRFPSEPVDDFAAWILAEDYLHHRSAR